MSDTPRHLTSTQLADAQQLMDDAGLPAWRVMPTPGHADDPTPLYRAERSGSILQSVIHTDAHTLVKLAQEIEARVAPKPVEVQAGMLSAVPTGGTKTP